MREATMALQLTICLNKNEKEKEKMSIRVSVTLLQEHKKTSAACTAADVCK